MSGASSGCALLLGASKGIGRATAIELARRGEKRLVITYHTDKEGIRQTARAAEDHGAEVVCVQADVAQRDSVNEVRAAAIEAGWTVHRILMSASTGRWVPLTVIGGRALRRTVDTMGLSVVTACSVFRDHLIDGGTSSSVVSLSSHGSIRSLPFYGPMAVAKAMLEACTRELGDEFAPYGVRVNCVRGWIVDTDSFRSSPAPEVTETITISRTPAGRMLVIDDLSSVAVELLAGDHLRMFNGAVITVDGGYGIVA